MEDTLTQKQAMKNFFEIMLNEERSKSKREEDFNQNIVAFIDATLRKNSRYADSKAQLQVITNENGKNEYKVVVDNLLEMELFYDDFFKEKNTPEKFKKCYEFFYSVNESILRAYKEKNYDNFVPTTKEDEITKYLNYTTEKLTSNENKIYIDSAEEAALLTLAQVTKTITSLKAVGLEKQKDEIRNEVIKEAKTIVEINMNENAFLEEAAEEYEKENEVVLELDDNGKPQSIKINKLDEIVAVDPSILSKEKVLNNKFNKDGSKKELDELENLRKLLLNSNEKNTKLNAENKELISSQINSSIDFLETQLIIEKGSIENLSEARKLLGDEALINMLDRCIERKENTFDLSKEELNPAIKFFNDNIDDVFFKLSDSATKDLTDIMEMIEKRRTDDPHFCT